MSSGRKILYTFASLKSLYQNNKFDHEKTTNKDSIKNKYFIKLPQYNKNIIKKYYHYIIINYQYLKKKIYYITLNQKNIILNYDYINLKLWLFHRFDKCFNEKNIKPLKLFIDKDISLVYLTEYCVPINYKILFYILHEYVNNKNYYKSFRIYKHRYDLFGNKQSQIS